ncbi:MAG: hypothetical protein JJU36_00865 [Phycisphaeraceae bacterium]|nr:hypothetical protein [Phycisphaeraceae bacterium]
MRSPRLGEYLASLGGLLVVGLTAGLMLLHAWAGWASPAAQDSGSRQPYKHILTLYDAEGRIIDPTAPDARPYSPRMTCGQCHDYDSIAKGWHFNAAAHTVSVGRPGEPWFLVDEETGSQIPISDRDWPGTHTPESLGLTPWEFALKFGRHNPAPAPYGEPGDQPDDPKARWEVSGRLEIDCMMCHSADTRYDPAERARQLQRQNFQWIPTVAMGLGRVRTDVRDLEEEDPLAALDPAYEGPQLPPVEYNRNKFDAQGRVFFDVRSRPLTESCYHCHSSRQVGPDAPVRWHLEQDVHLAAGMSCTDCHRNSIDHKIVRGHETEAIETADPARGTLSCAGCHLGDDQVDHPAMALGGRGGAPHPLHRGIPPIHFEILSCTACHSGPWPEQHTHPVQTSMAHGLGISSTDRTWQTPPEIVAPVMAKGHDGKIAPHRMAWPSFWGWLLPDGEVRPIAPDQVKGAAGPLLSALASRADGDQADEPPARDPSADDQPIIDVLEAISMRLSAGAAEGAVPVLIRDGYLHHAEEERLIRKEHSAGEPYLWPLAHDVRPAAQSLGVRGCTDCHATDAPFYFGMVSTSFGQGDPARPIKQMYELHTQQPVLARAWAMAFATRPAFQVFLFACTLVTLLVLVRYGLSGLGTALGAVADRR